MTHGAIRLLAVALFVLEPQALAQEREPGFRVGIIGQPSECHSSGDARDDPALRAYAKHLGARLGRSVELCGVDEADAVEALAAGRVDLVRLKRSAMGADEPAVRPLMHARQKGRVARTEFVVVGLSNGTIPGAEPPRMDTATPLAFNASERESMAVLLRKEASELGDPDGVEAELGEALAGAQGEEHFVVNVGRYTVFCQENEALCSRFNIAWRGFSPLNAAWCVRQDLDKELRYRILGIHAVLHSENPQAFIGVAGESADAFEPTEPWAFRFVNTLD